MIHEISRAFVAALLAVAAAGCAGKAPAGPPVAPAKFVVRDAPLPGGKTRKYTVYLPRGYDGSKRWPTVVFLQGLGEGGTDGRKQTSVGLGPAIRRRDRAGKPFEMIAVFPQSGGKWTTGDADAIATACMDDAERAYAIDKRRVYLTGMSTGGYGVWKLGARHPDRFAALVPVCPGDGKEFARELLNLPVWAFHLAFDPIVWSGGTRATVDRINKLGGNARATIYSGVGHNCWDRAYDDPKLWQWLLAQSK